MIDKSYYDLACRLLQVHDLPPGPLGLPGWDYQSDRPLQAPSDWPGGFGDETEQRIAAEVCRRVQGMTAERWTALDERERLPWMELAVNAKKAGHKRGGRPSKDEPDKHHLVIAALAQYHDDIRIAQRVGKL